MANLHALETWTARLNWKRLDETVHYTVSQALAIQRIPAPTFHEQARAQYIAQVFDRLHLEDIVIDDVFNVYGRLPGRLEGPGLMLSAHTDTIFPAETDLTTRREHDVIFGPGLGDNSIGVAGMLGVIQWLYSEGVQPDYDVWCVATSREEGLGDLGGMKAAFQRLRPRIYAVVNLEGLALGHVYHAGISVRRLHIEARTGGGHSWLHFGRPSAVHTLLQIGARITSLAVPTQPRTTFNVGMIDGGEAINAIASSAAMWLDMRSESRSELEMLEAHVRRIIAEFRDASPEVQLVVNVVGDRPAGILPPDHALVQAALVSLRALGMNGSLETGSTDGNIPLSHNVPTITIGFTRGGNAHRTDEFIELTPLRSGLQHVIGVVLTAASSPLFGLRHDLPGGTR
jgi:acetylornithine deacetylase/succinyl-diaminopimelate desuccinylase-like protein